MIVYDRDFARAEQDRGSVTSGSGWALLLVPLARGSSDWRIPMLAAGTIR